MADVRSLDLEALTLSPLNPRQIVESDGLADLAASIRLCGLIQNLCGLETPEGVQIVAGGRRLAALRLLADQGEWIQPVPVLVTDSPDEAREWAGAENAARVDLHPADEIANYAAMLANGYAPAAIAATFGTTTTRVAQRLKLAVLPDAALAALRAGKISLDQAAALTLVRADPAASADLLARAMNATAPDRLRSIALEHSVRADHDRRARFVGLDAYCAAGGAVARDLFSGVEVIDDPALLDHLYTDHVEAARAQIMAQGWGWVIVLDDQWFDYTLTRRVKESTTPPGNMTKAHRQLAGGWMWVTSSGEVQTRLGYVNAADEPAARAAGLLPPLPTPPAGAGAAPDSDDAGSEAGGDTGAFSAALLADLRAIRHHALVAALIAQPGCGNAVLAWAMGSPSRAKILDASIKAGPLVPETPDGFTPGDLRDPDPDIAPIYGGVAGAAAAITTPLLRALRYGFSWTGNDPDLMAVYRRAEAVTGARMRDHWVPTRVGFWGRVTSGYLDQMFAQLFGFAPSDDAARDFARLKKAEKAQMLHQLFNDPDTARGYRHMTTAAAQRIRDWVPVFE